MVVMILRRTVMLAIGLGAAAYSMRNKKTRRNVSRFIEPMFNMEMAEMMPSKKTMRMIKKQIKKTLS